MKHTKSMIIKPSDEARELSLFCSNNGELYEGTIRPIITNLKKYIKRGNYDEARAIDAFYPAACEGAKLYAKTYARLADYSIIFDVTARYTAAADLVNDFYNEIFDI